MHGLKSLLFLIPLVSAVYVDFDTDRGTSVRRRQVPAPAGGAPASAPDLSSASSGLGSLFSFGSGSPAPLDLSFLGKRGEDDDDSDDESGGSKGKKGGSKGRSDEDEDEKEESKPTRPKKKASRFKSKPSKSDSEDEEPAARPAAQPVARPASGPLGLPLPLNLGGAPPAAQPARPPPPPPKFPDDDDFKFDPNPEKYGQPTGPSLSQAYDVKPALPALYPNAAGSPEGDYASSYKYAEGYRFQGRGIPTAPHRKRQYPSNQDPSFAPNSMPRPAPAVNNPAKEDVSGFPNSVDAKSAPRTAASVPLPLPFKREINSHLYHDRRQMTAHNADYEQRDYHDMAVKRARRAHDARSVRRGRY